MLNIRGLTYLQGGIPLLENSNLQIFANQRIGLVGKNGCGKSTLFRLIRGVIKPDSGEVSLQPGKTIAFVEQEIVNSNQPASEFVLDGDVELRRLEKILAQAEHDAAWFEAQQHYEAIDGYTARARAAQLLKGLGFANSSLDLPVNHFSGGWRMRLNLARALMHRADLLLLDEPTNHLDLESITAFNNALKDFPGTVLFTSHDHEFTQTVANRIIEITPNGFIDKLMTYDEYIENEKVAEQKVALYA